MRNLELVEANREATSTARRIFGADERELLWILRAYHGSDDVRAPCETRASAEPAARRLVRGSHPSPDSADCWPGAMAVYRGAPVSDASEPQAEPSGENPPELLSSAARFANGHAAERLARPSRGVNPAGSFQEIEAGRGHSSPAPPVSPCRARNVPGGTRPRVGVRQECGMMGWIHQLGSSPIRYPCAPLVARVFESSVPPRADVGAFFSPAPA